MLLRLRWITSAVLVLVVATSASGCATGFGSSLLASCRGGAGTMPDCFRAKAAVAAAACGDLLRSSSRHCSLRHLAQFQFVNVGRFDVPSPLLPAPGIVSPGSNAVIIVSSIGSPETDRGPPRS
jgi:hypothetical protein